MKSRNFLLAACVSMSVVGCANGTQNSRTVSSDLSSKSAGGSPASSAPMAGEMKASSSAAAGGKPGGAPSDSPTLQLATLQVSQPDRYLIKNATISVEAKDVRAAANKITTSVSDSKGYSSDMHEAVDGLGSLSITLTVRIPFTAFASSMSQIETLGKVMEKQVTAEDVTEEFVDSDAKVRNLKHTEERLLTHLNKTGKLADTLLVEKEINRVRQEIEQIEGRLRFLSNRTSFSTIQITLKETARAQALTPPESFSVAHVFSEATRNVVEFGRSLVSMGIWLAVWGVIWLPIVLAIIWIVQGPKRKRRAAIKRAQGIESAG